MKISPSALVTLLQTRGFGAVGPFKPLIPLIPVLTAFRNHNGPLFSQISVFQIRAVPSGIQEAYDRTRDTFGQMKSNIHRFIFPSFIPVCATALSFIPSPSRSPSRRGTALHMSGRGARVAGIWLQQLADFPNPLSPNTSLSRLLRINPLRAHRTVICQHYEFLHSLP
ncbi:hypothetical protein A0H81_02162 [Grifola frondosa]|uniref:Uncharacterized protein n=1 Tax=Grifola frondosa TaxID=5627 RepID=A0A1C7MNE9_GRIFR|nr:hypothetical protein A0H81_02162 [Grifola frondosa]